MIPQRKKIAILHPRIVEVGGAVKMMIHLGIKLSKYKNDVVFFTTSFLKDNFDIKIPIYESKFRFKIISYLIIAYKIRNYDIVFVGNSPMHIVGVLSKILFNAKFTLIWWNHHFPWYYEKKHNNVFVEVKKYIEKFSIKYIDLLIANSIYIKKSLLTLFGQDRQIKILHPVISDKFVGYKGKQIRQKSKINIFTYSRWVTGKNIKVIFDMYDNLNKKYNFNLFIGGDGNEINKYKRKYINNDNIFILGNLSQDEILEYGLKSDIFLFPSLIDSFGMSILEMMFLSLPIICFNFGGVNELVKNGKNGFLCKSTIDFIEKTELLLKDNILKNKMGMKSLDIACDNFGGDIFNRELENIFN